MKLDLIWEDCPKPVIDPKSPKQREIAKEILQQWVEEMAEDGYELLSYVPELRSGLFKVV